MNPVLDAARAYSARGWSVIPLKPGGKIPLFSWAEYQRRHATDSELVEWFGEHPNRNVGIVTGRISGIVVVDVDRHRGGEFAAPGTITVLTPHSGEHYYYRLPEGALIPTGVDVLGVGVDVRGEGGFVVAPPSVLDDGSD